MTDCEHKWVLNRCVKCDARRGSSATHYDQLTAENARLLAENSRLGDFENLWKGCQLACDGFRTEVAELRTMASSRLETMHVQSDQLDRQRTEIERLNKRLDRGKHGD